MRKFYFLSLASLLSLSAFGQIQPVNVNIESPHLRSVNDGFTKTTQCVADTIQYAIAKATSLSVLNVNNATSASAVGQYFDAPQALTISGTDFYAYKVNTTGGASINVTVSVFNASPVDSLPTGTALVSTTVLVDTSYGGGALDTLRKSALFSSPITVTQPYVIVVENNSPNGIGVVNNSYTAADGNQEWLGFGRIATSWLHGYEISIGGAPYDADVLIEPYVSYGLTASFSNDGGCLSGAQTVNFTNMSSPVLENRMYNVAAFQSLTDLSFTYEYGDGSLEENLMDPSHAYGAAGPYTVTLTDTIYGWSRNCFDDTVITIGADLEADYSLVNNGLQKSFTDNSTSSQTVSSWSWDFGDGNTSTQQNPSHTYATGGIYTVCLTVTDACGSDSHCQSVDATCADPVADFSNNANDLTITFTDNSTSGQTISSWAWDFGDGNTSTQQSPSHTYATSGTYTVCLTVTDACGSDSECQSVDATCAAPVANFSNNANELAVTFTDNSTSVQTISSWAWDFGDGNTSTQQNPSHTYSSAGTYTVCLSVTDNCGTNASCGAVTVTENTNSISGFSNKSIKLFPNPASDQLNIVLKEIPEQIEVLSIMGQKVATILPQKQLLDIDVSNWAKGIYFLQFQFKDQTIVTQKISVQ